MYWRLRIAIVNPAIVNPAIGNPAIANRQSPIAN